MDPLFSVLKPEERLVLSLRQLYEQYGYRKYRMSRFEEYRLYMDNKNFLVSESVISFTDLDGRLLALKPDVTLSIVRHAAENEEQRVYYIENVYRPDRARLNFREIGQMGLERIGRIDAYAIRETVMLAAQTLRTVSAEGLLAVSHMGFVTGLLRALRVPDDTAAQLLRLIAEKNVHEIRSLCAASVSDSRAAELLSAVPALCGKPSEILPRAGKLCISAEMQAAVDSLKALFDSLSDAEGLCGLVADLSLVGEEDYYNGVIFGGYVNGLPTRVLSGGQYDRLMQKFGNSCGAIGFALYLSELELLFAGSGVPSCDETVVYEPGCDAAALAAFLQKEIKDGKTVYPCPAGAKTTVTSEKTVRFGKEGESSC